MKTLVRRVIQGLGIAEAQSLSNPYLSALPGCPRAGDLTLGAISAVCGDNTLKARPRAGTYTLLPTDANFIPTTFHPGSATPFDLTDTPSGNYGSSPRKGAYTDISSGVFQTCASGTDCDTANGNFAEDIVDQSGATPSPTAGPASLELRGTGIVALGLRKRYGSRHSKTFAL